MSQPHASRPAHPSTSRGQSRYSASMPPRPSGSSPVPRPVLKTQKSASRSVRRRAQPGSVAARRGHETAAQPLLSSHRKKVLWAGGAITLLAMATILPTQVSSQAIPSSSCEQVIKSGAEVSRGQLSKLLTISEGTRRAAVRQSMSDPYCTMPSVTLDQDSNKTGESVTVEREAYPLAFDPEAWVVLSYEADKYSGYDFVFKP